MAEIKQLTQKRITIRTRLTKFATYLDEFEQGKKSGVHQLRTRLAKAKESWKEFDDIQIQIELLIKDKKEETREALVRDEFEEFYFQTTSIAERLLDTYIQPNPMSSQVMSENSSFDCMNSVLGIKLPPLKLPIFNGAYHEWLEYYDTFKTLIDSNKVLSDIQKFHYLRSSLTGEALDVIKSLTISSSNYSVAWNLLIEQYQCARTIIFKHANSLLNLAVVSKGRSHELKHLLNSAKGKIRALEALNIPIGSWDVILICILLEKLDANSRHKWAALTSNKKSIDIPTITEFFEFLGNRCQYLEDVESSEGVGNKIKPGVIFPKPKVMSNRTSSFVGITSPCPLCKATEHAIFSCPQFIQASVSQRNQHVRELKLCFNCLSSSHQLRACKAGPCRKCQSRHNTLLHNENIDSTVQATHTSTTLANHAAQACALASSVLLQTAIVCIKDRQGQLRRFRALLDSGSQINFITEKASKLLGMKLNNVTCPVNGICGTTTINKCIDAIVQSQYNSYRTKLQFAIIPKITTEIPFTTIRKSVFNIPENIQLADPTFHISSHIDLLIGAEIYGELLCVGQIKEHRDAPIFQKTQFGWIAFGRLPVEQATGSICTLSTHSLEENIGKFWELEEIPKRAGFNEEEWRCEEHFRKHVQRNAEGRFMVSLPFRENKGDLGESRAIALKRFEALERKLNRNKQLKSKYCKFLSEYEQLGHMRLAHIPPNIPQCYLPHHAVFKEHSTTTKLRVVFDASAQTASGLSLNQVLLKGPTIQNSLLYMVLRMRIHNIIITADIEKMYRQVLMNDDDANFQLILWRYNDQEPISTYKLQTVTYGTTPAAYLVTRCLQQLAIKERQSHPEAARVLENDLITGTETVEAAIHLWQELFTLLQSGGFNLCKMRSNAPNVQKDTSDSSCAPVLAGKQIEERTLGLLWDSQADVLRYSLQQGQLNKNITKRLILSTISQIYDPLGLLGPIIIVAKMIMQQLWQLGFQWDESVPQNIFTIWQNYQAQLIHINELNVPRRAIEMQPYQRMELHGFCDALQKAYGVCVYLRATDKQGKCSTRLLCATCLQFDENFLWSDSTVVLARIKAPARIYKTRDCSSSHVNTKENPADHISRRLMSAELLYKNLWWHGPEWLQLDQGCWPNIRSGCSEEDIDREVLESRPDEYATLLTQIEACLNSRPLTPTDMNTLIPAHFLHINTTETLAEPNLFGLADNRLSRWQHLQKMRRDFWYRWSKDYLSTLQHRTKRKTAGSSVTEGSMVLCIDDNLPPQRWSIGRVAELHPGSDSVVRVVSVKTSKGIVKRAVNRLCILPIDV